MPPVVERVDPGLTNPSFSASVSLQAKVEAQGPKYQASEQASTAPAAALQQHVAAKGASAGEKAPADAASRPAAATSTAACVGPAGVAALNAGVGPGGAVEQWPVGVS